AIRIDVDGQTVTVPFHLKCPVIAHRRRWLERRKARLDTVRHGIEWQVRLCGITRFARFRFCDLVILEKGLGAAAHLLDRLSAATDFFSASMMLITLLGPGFDAGAFDLPRLGFFK